MNTIIDLDLMGLILAYVFALLLLVIVRSRGIKKEKEIIVSTLRMTVQLVAVGYLLILVFEKPDPFITLLILVVMLTFASIIVITRSGSMANSLKWVVALAIGTGSILTLLYFTALIIRIDPWYDPRYFIPVAGMIVGNVMNASALGLKTLQNGFRDRFSEVENSLMLGASPSIAMKPIVNRAFDSSITPTITSMLGMGIVSLPGMMTGQILSGTLPVTAIKYQIGIMLAIMGSVSLASIILLTLGSRTFFTKDGMLLSPVKKETKS